MTDEEVGELLSVAAGYDRRTVGRTDVEAWQLALDDPRIPNMCLGECVDAVILHYRDTTDFIMPAHILTRVKAERAATIAQIMPPAKVDPEAYAKVGSLWSRALKEAKTRTAANRAAVLAHPDLAEKLTEPPLGYAVAEQWNGGIPAETFNGGHNDSPRRAALAAIVEEAMQRAAITRKEDHA
jgi:hypothetical protein